MKRWMIRIAKKMSKMTQKTIITPVAVLDLLKAARPPWTCSFVISRESPALLFARKPTNQNKNDCELPPVMRSSQLGKITTTHDKARMNGLTQHSFSVSRRSRI
jgi:hypothetical protein